MQPPMNDTQKRIPEPAIIHNKPATENPQPQNTGVKVRQALAIEKEKLKIQRRRNSRRTKYHKTN